MTSTWEASGHWLELWHLQRAEERIALILFVWLVFVNTNKQIRSISLFIGHTWAKENATESSESQYENTCFFLQLPHMLMTKPDMNEKDSDKKQRRGQRHLSGGDELLKGFLLVHESCAEISNNATPRRFMSFLHCYRQLYKSKKEGVEEKQKHLQVHWEFYVFNALALIFTCTFENIVYLVQ